ncbi:MAG: hypothetical protein SFY32_01560 [Bacteroidota bacterium]|nr:hypothetical protein [Bacteroidota bacterium]
MPVKTVFKKHVIFSSINVISILLLIVWIFKSCLNINSTFIGITMDFSALMTCMYSIIRVGQSLKGKFQALNMITIYYASMFFSFVWLVKMVYLIWDHFYLKVHDDVNLAISVVVFITSVINFFTIEKVNLDNIEKIKSEADNLT